MRILVALAAAFALATPAVAQSAALRADSLFRAEDWEGAVAAYQSIIDGGSTSGQAWFRLGYALLKSGRYERAVAVFETADTLGFARATTRYGAAAAHARLGNVERAFQWLGGALDTGFRSVEALESDEDLASLRGDPRFRLVVERADRAARPCAYDEHYEEFDFWLGEWEVYSQQGRLVGTSMIQKIENGCLVIESWTAAAGGSGKSINYYNPASGKWKQVWVDGAGGIIEVVGEFAEGAMRFEGTHTYSTGRRELYRMAFTPRPDGSVRQFIEQSRDDGESWYVWLDGIYVKKTPGG